MFFSKTVFFVVSILGNASYLFWGKTFSYLVANSSSVLVHLSATNQELIVIGIQVLIPILMILNLYSGGATSLGLAVILLIFRNIGLDGAQLISGGEIIECATILLFFLIPEIRRCSIKNQRVRIARWSKILILSHFGAIYFFGGMNKNFSEYASGLSIWQFFYHPILPRPWTEILLTSSPHTLHVFIGVATIVLEIGLGVLLVLLVWRPNLRILAAWIMFGLHFLFAIFFELHSFPFLLMSLSIFVYCLSEPKNEQPKKKTALMEIFFITLISMKWISPLVSHQLGRTLKLGCSELGSALNSLGFLNNWNFFERGSNTTVRWFVTAYAEPNIDLISGQDLDSKMVGYGSGFRSSVLKRFLSDYPDPASLESSVNAMIEFAKITTARPNSNYDIFIRVQAMNPIQARIDFYLFYVCSEEGHPEVKPITTIASIYDLYPDLERIAESNHSGSEVSSNRLRLVRWNGVRRHCSQ